MDLSDPKLILLLRQMTQTARECRLTAQLTGENFNVFKLLGLGTAEVRTHSAFIAELLNPKGSHDQGATYLRLFLKHLGLDHLPNPDEANVKIEYHVGPVDNDRVTGGQIDIVLMDDARKPLILIENKIYAGDLNNQLLRYHRFCPDAVLVYLTLDGRDPAEKSTGGQNLDIRRVSYKTHILQWLEECHKVSVSLPVVRETILQYENLIRELTNQAMGDKMKEQAKKIILANPDCADAIVLLGEAWQSILDKVKQSSCQQIHKHNNIEIKLDLENGVTIGRYMPIDKPCGDLAIAFRAYREKLDKPCDEAQKYADILKGLVPSVRTSPWWNVGYFNPYRFGKSGRFEDLSKQEILSFYENETKLNGFVCKVQDWAEDITKKLFDKIKSC